MEAYIDLISRPEGYMDLNAVPEPAGGGVALIDTTPHLYRISADGQNIGSQEFDEIVGGTVAWNQQHNTKTGTATSNGVTFVADGEKIVATGASSTTETYYIAQNSNVTFIKDHVYLLLGAPSGGSTSTYDINYIATSAFGTSGNTRLIDIGNGKISKAMATQTSKNCRIYVNSGAGTVTNLAFTPQLFDLTQMFGSTIADYILSLETAHAGDGVAWFKNLFPNDYYAYDSGTLMSVQTSEHKMVGKNLIRTDDDTLFNTSARWWGKTDTTLRDRINVLPVGTYTCSFKFRIDTITGSATTGNYGVMFRFNNGSNVDKQVRRDLHNIEVSTEYSYSASFEITSDIVGKCTNAYFYTGRTPTASADYVTFYDFQFEYGNTATPYEPYISHSYPLDSSLTLRGIPKLIDNKLSYDGDIYQSDGTVTRKYRYVDLGTLTWQYNSSYGIMYANPGSQYNIKDSGLCVCQNYIYMPNSDRGATDKSIGLGTTGWFVNTIWVRDSAYTDATTFKTAMSGVYLVYELATPTTETATPYTNPQMVAKGGTEEYVDTRDVPIPVGHNTKYQGVLL